MNKANKDNTMKEYKHLEKELTKAIWLRRIKAFLCITGIIAWFSSIFFIDALNTTGVIGMVGSIACAIVWLVFGAIGGLWFLWKKQMVEE